MRCYCIIATLFLTISFFVYKGNAYADVVSSKIVPYVSVRETYDSNIFRVKDKQQLANITGDYRLSDYVTILTAGINLNYPVKMHEIDLLLRKDFLRYNHYTIQDSEQDDFKGNVSFKFLDLVRAKIHGGYTKSLESRENYITLNKNERTVWTGVISLDYGLPSGFNMHLAFKQENVDFSISELGNRENEMKGLSGYLSYSSPSSYNTKINFIYERDVINYNSLQSIGDQLVDNNNTRNSIRLELYRKFSPKTSLFFSGGHLWKKYNEFNRRDFDGGIGQAEVTYGMTEKLTLYLTAERKLHEEIFLDQIYSIDNSTGLKLEYEPTAKIALSVYSGLSTRSFKGNSDILTDSFPSRGDRLKKFSTVVMWLPVKQVNMELQYSLTTRDSNFDIYNYVDNMVDMAFSYRF